MISVGCLRGLLTLGRCDRGDRLLTLEDLDDVVVDLVVDLVGDLFATNSSLSRNTDRFHEYTKSVGIYRHFVRGGERGI